MPGLRAAREDPLAHRLRAARLLEPAEPDVLALCRCGDVDVEGALPSVNPRALILRLRAGLPLRGLDGHAEAGGERVDASRRSRGSWRRWPRARTRRCLRRARSAAPVRRRGSLPAASAASVPNDWSSRLKFTAPLGVKPGAGDVHPLVLAGSSAWSPTSVAAWAGAAAVRRRARRRLKWLRGGSRTAEAYTRR